MSAASAKKNKMSFEQATARLESIVERIDNPETGLEEMISLVEEGLKLIHSSRQLLNDAELRIRRLENPDAAPAPAAPTTPVSRNDDDFSLI